MLTMLLDRSISLQTLHIHNHTHYLCKWSVVKFLNFLQILVDLHTVVYLQVFLYNYVLMIHSEIVYGIKNRH